MPFNPDDPADGPRLLRRHHEATIQHHERRADIRLITDGATGCIVFPCEPGFAAASELVLHLPDEATCHLQLAVEPTILSRPESEECVDRWHAYHAAASSGSAGGGAGSGGSGGGGGGSRAARVWLRCTITGAKRPQSPGDVYEPEALMQPNLLRKAEPRLVKHINASRDRLAALCRKRANIDVADPLCVGIDPFGLDVRARFGIIRIEFDLEAASPEQAQALIDAMLHKAA